jgi:hypothetical protein
VDGPKHLDSIPVTMNIEDLYDDREGLMTADELEDYHHEPSTETIPTYTPAMRDWLIRSLVLECPSPEAATRREFERRPPALGASKELLVESRMHAKLLPPVQQRRLFSGLRSKLLRHLIPCSGASTTDQLLDILQAELDSGVPAPIPGWYKFSTVTMGPRKIGYDACSNRGCFQTETLEVSFSRCARCKLPQYCSRECQTGDWKARHKHLCKEAMKQREQMKGVGKMMQAISDMSLTGQLDSGTGGITAALQDHKTNAAVKERRKQLRAEKKRPIGKDSEGPDPDFL